MVDLSIIDAKPISFAPGFVINLTHSKLDLPVVITEQGGGFVRNGKIKNIFAINSRKKTKNEKADKLLNFIWENYNMLPFALRWITKEWEEKEARELLEILVKKKAVQAYPVLIEVNEQRVAQAEHTFIPIESGVTVTTKALT